jgi:hypothetical protein
MPSDFAYGKVVGLYLLGVADTADVDRLPNPKAATGIITFSSAVPVVKTTQPSAAVGKQSFNATVNPQGYLVDEQGNPGLWLFTGVWTVSYNLPGLPIATHQIEVLATHTDAAPLDLVQAAPPGSQPVTPTEYAELSARIDAIGAPSDAAVAGYVATPATQTRVALETDFAQIDDPRFGSIGPQLQEDVAKGVQAYEFQTGKQVIDTTGLPTTTHTPVLTTSMLEIILAHPGSTRNQTINPSVAAPEAVVGRVVTVHIPANPYRFKWGTNVVVESQINDAYIEVWGSLIFEADGLWHFVSAARPPYLKGGSGTAFAFDENIDLFGWAEKMTATAIENVIIGKQSCNDMTSGQYNVSVGSASNYSLTTGTFNVAIGASAGVLWNKTTINHTVAIGTNAAVAVEDGIAIGHNSDVNDTHTSSVALGATVQTNAANQVAIGARDLEIQANGTKGLVLRSPNGTRYRVTVSDAGALVVTAA